MNENDAHQAYLRDIAEEEYKERQTKLTSEWHTQKRTLPGWRDDLTPTEDIVLRQKWEHQRLMMTMPQPSALDGFFKGCWFLIKLLIGLAGVGILICILPPVIWAFGLAIGLILWACGAFK